VRERAAAVEGSERGAGRGEDALDLREREWRRRAVSGLGESDG
jgi:hypothetical protein